MQLLRTPFDSYVIIHLTTRPHNPCATLNNNKNLQEVAADVFRGPPPKQQITYFSVTGNH